MSWRSARRCASSFTGDHAYLVWPATYSYDRKTLPMRETAQWIFTLVKRGALWKITGWTWSAPEATRQTP